MCYASLKKTFFSNGSVASIIRAEVFNLEQKKKTFSFPIKKNLKKYVAVFKYISFWKNSNVLKKKS